jgi:hypothetical protein
LENARAAVDFSPAFIYPFHGPKTNIYVPLVFGAMIWMECIPNCAANPACVMSQQAVPVDPAPYGSLIKHVRPGKRRRRHHGM